VAGATCSDAKAMACATAGKSCSANGCKDAPAKQALLSPKAAASQQLVAKK
jgi:hypothetical protein